MAEGGGDASRFLHVDGKAAAYFTSCGSMSFPALVQEQLDASSKNKHASSADKNTTAAGVIVVAAPSPKRRSPKKIKVG